MRSDTSYGIVPFQIATGTLYVYMVCHLSGHWALPKGHPEENETELECAKRELFEETGLIVDKLLSDEPLIERYQFKHRGTLINKTVGYFVAVVSGVPKIQAAEIREGRWLELSDARNLATYPQMKSLLYTASQIVNNKLSE